MDKIKKLVDEFIFNVLEIPHRFSVALNSNLLFSNACHILAIPFGMVLGFGAVYIFIR